MIAPIDVIVEEINKLCSIHKAIKSSGNSKGNQKKKGVNNQNNSASYSGY